MPQTVLFDRYRLVAPAGTGGSAEVWRAIDQKTGDEVAVKRLHPVVFADEAGRRRLQREFDALRALDEPHIVRVRDLQIGDREAALILDYVDGSSLAQTLAERREAGDGPMAPEAAVAIVGEVAAALAAAHAAGIVHRDVTPGNILLPPGGARLTDFGIAHASGDQTAVTATGLLMGTMRFLAPEQLRGEPSTPASDLHALAATAYEMLAGRPAFEATSPVGLVEAQRAGPAPIGGIGPALDAAVRHGLAVDPADRPADVTAFAASLSAALAAEPTQALTIPDEVAVASPTRAAELAGPLAAPIASAVGAAPPAVATGTPPTPRRTRFNQRRHTVPALVGIVGIVLAAGLLAAASGSDRPLFGAANGPRASATASLGPAPTATPTTTPTPKEHKGHGHGKGEGDG